MLKKDFLPENHTIIMKAQLFEGLSTFLASEMALAIAHAN
jgi:hypothetical protein